MPDDDLGFSERRLEDIFEACVRAYPDRIAVVAGSDTATYADIDLRANALAAHLIDLGVIPGALVGLFADRSIDLIVGILGILKAGGAYLPIDESAPPARLRWLLSDSGAGFVVTTRARASQFAGLPVTLVLPGPATNPQTGAGLARPGARAGRTPADLAYVIYTSGSTGHPKGVQVEHRQVTRLFASTSHWFDFGPDDVWTLFHSVAFDYSVWEIWGALLFGGRLVVVPAQTCRSPARFRELLEQHHVTVLSQTPSAFLQLDAADRSAPGRGDDLHELRLVVLGGERLNVGVLAGWMKRRGDRRPMLVNMYGITEVTVHASFRPIGADDLDRPELSPIGRPLPDLRFYVLNADGALAAAGDPGELYIAGAGLARGYLNRPDLTSARFGERAFAGGERVYQTGDLVQTDQAGEYYYLGRTDDQLKIRGYRVEPREIEQIIETHPDVVASVVVGRDYGEGDVRLVAYLVGQDHQVDPSWASRVRLALADAFAGLPTYLRPSAYVPVESLPLTANGKVDRAGLPAPPAAADHRPQPELGPVRSAIAAIWTDVLNVPAVSPDEDFFELGGTSLAMVRMVNQVNARFGTDIGVESLVDRPTVSSLAKILESVPPPLACARPAPSAPVRPAAPSSRDDDRARAADLARLASAFADVAPLCEVLDPAPRFALDRAGSGLAAEPEAIQLLLDELARDFGVRAPRVVVGASGLQAAELALTGRLAEAVTAVSGGAPAGQSTGGAQISARTVDAADGTKLRCYSAGPADRPAVALIAACGMPVGLIKGWITGLAGQFRVLTWETRGLFCTGGRLDADFDGRGHDVAAQARDLSAVLDAFGVGTADVIGFCGGAAVALAADRSRSRSLTLWHGDFELGSGVPKTSHQKDVQTLMVMAARSRTRAAGLHELMSRPATAERLQAEVAHHLIYPYATAELLYRYGRLNGSIMTTDSRPSLATVDVPTLVVSSETDQITHPAGSVFVASRIRGARLELRPDGDHLSAFDAAPESAELVLEFLGGALPGAA